MQTPSIANSTHFPNPHLTSSQLESQRYNLIFKVSVLWANAFYKLQCLSVCPCVHVFVRLFTLTFEVPFSRFFSPTSQSWMSKVFRDSESLGKSNEKKWSPIWIFTNKRCKNAAQKKNSVFFANSALPSRIFSVLVSLTPFNGLFSSHFPKSNEQTF